VARNIVDITYKKSGENSASENIDFWKVYNPLLIDIEICDDIQNILVNMGIHQHIMEICTELVYIITAQS
jgi:hypothetical protein